MKTRRSKRRRVCFVTGTRAEFGLMERTLRAIQRQPGLELQCVVTGMHLDPRHGQTIDVIRRAGWKVDAVVPWRPAGADLNLLAEQTGMASARLASVFDDLETDIVLVVGDRVEPFAAASAGHLSGRTVAHVHGGDRARGQVDDALRHAITKLAHVHLAATKDAAQRILKMGEDRGRVHVVGSPGLDGIRQEAWSLRACADWLVREDTALAMTPDPQPLRKHQYAFLLYHPTEPDETREYERVRSIHESMDVLPARMRRLVVYPNNDPGAGGVVGYWKELQRRIHRATPEEVSREVCVRNLPRAAFLGLLRDAAVLLGNSSSGIIEAASFGTPVIDVGGRQGGRLRGENVTNVPFGQRAIRRALRKVWNAGRPIRFPPRNPYGRGDTARRIARILAEIDPSERVPPKLIAY